MAWNDLFQQNYAAQLQLVQVMASPVEVKSTNGLIAKVQLWKPTPIHMIREAIPVAGGDMLHISLLLIRVHSVNSVHLMTCYASY
jgi:hypothetical protein